MACRLGGQENVYHAAEHCLEYESEVWENIRGGIAMMSVGDDGRRFEQVRGGHCQYEGLFIRLYVVFVMWYQEEGLALVKEMTREEEYPVEPRKWCI